MEPKNWISDKITNLSKRDILIIATFSSVVIMAVLLFFVFPGSEPVTAADPCLACHGEGGEIPGVYGDWNSSVHATENVTCIDCHEAQTTDPDAISHNGYTISPVVSPLDCAKCHVQQVEEFNQSLHSLGALYYEDLFKKEKLNFLESQIEGGYIIRNDEELIHAATMRGCQSCHGTNMTGKKAEDFDVWPNNGIGRINPDGSKGSCSACHTRHSFSIAEARHPETCGQCHMGPDHPQIEMYMESKHGNIYSAEGDSWNWSKKNWTAGVDYRAPTCAGCHMSGIPGNPDVPTTHDVSARLSWELESEVSRRTDNTANALGVPISDGSTWQTKQGRMKAVCNQCHSTTWVDNYYEQADVAVELHDKQYAEAKEFVTALYEEGLLTTQAFDEPIEFKIYEMWHHEGRRARMGAFMMAPDYVQWHGFYDMFQDRVEIEHMAEEIRLAAMEPEEEPIIVFLARDGPGTTIYLKWEITNSTNVDHYELFWGTSLVSDYSSATPNANTQDDLYAVEGLTANTTYYFTIVAVDSDGNETAVAFSSAMPPKAESVDPADKDADSDTDGIDPILPLLLAIVALLIGLIAIMIAMRKKTPSSGADETKVDETTEKSPEDDAP
jgi:hypothetical protein